MIVVTINNNYSKQKNYQIKYNSSNNNKKLSKIYFKVKISKIKYNNNNNSQL